MEKVGKDVLARARRGQPGDVKAAKKPYVTPVLKRLGSVRELTLTASHPTAK